MFNITTTTSSRQKVARLSYLLYHGPTGGKKTMATRDTPMNVLLPMATIGNTNSSTPVVTQQCLSSTMTQASASSSAAAASSSSSYVSPYQDLFEMMKDNNSSSSTNNSSSSSSSAAFNFLSSSSTSRSTPSQTNVPRLQCGIPETLLKFRTTCYDRLMLAPYVQPSEYKVILQVQMKHLPLETDEEKEIFYQIVGTRFNHDSQELKLTSNQFASRIENKRHLCWMLDRIVMGAKNLARDSYR